MLFVITKPDVFKSPNSDTYIIFGEVSVALLLSTYILNFIAQITFKYKYIYYTATNIFSMF